MNDRDTHRPYSVPGPSYSLPGGKMDVASRTQWIASMIKGTMLFGPQHRRVLRAARSHSRTRLHESERSWARSAARAIRLDIEVSGLEHIDPSRPYVVTPLHEGFTDLIALQRLPLNMIYAAAEELFSWDYLGPYLRASGQPVVSQGSGASSYRAMLRAGKEATARNESLVVFPQGTVLGIETAFQPGAFRVAQHLDVPLLPVVLTGSASVWDFPFSTRLNTGGSIHMEVLAPVAGRDAVKRAHSIETAMKDRALEADPAPRRFDPARDGWWDGYRYEIDSRFPDLRDAVADHRSRAEDIRVAQSSAR